MSDFGGIQSQLDLLKYMLLWQPWYIEVHQVHVDIYLHYCVHHCTFFGPV